MRISNYAVTIAISFILCFTFLLGTPVAASDHRLEAIHIHTFIHKDGSATITETRSAILSEGTENYDIIDDLGASTIQNFTVEEDGTVYEFIENWNLDASREEKAYKNGIIKTDTGYELVWGIGEYGPHKYVLQYTVTDFIKQLDDSQVLFWRYVNDGTNIPPERVTIEIETKKTLNAEDEKIWAFGFDGRINFDDGNVVATSDSPLSSSHYATILIKFADGQFATTDVLPLTFEDLREEAFIGSDYDDAAYHDGVAGGAIESTTDDSFPFWLFILIPLVILVPLGIGVILVGIVIYHLYKRGQRANSFKGEYERDYPYDGPFADTYQLLTDMGVSSFDKLVAAFLLKWVKDDYIDIKSEEVGVVFKSKAPVIYLLKEDVELEGLEGRLFNMLLRAANGETKLDRSHFVKWIEKNRKTVRTWEQDVKQNSIDTLLEAGHFHMTEKKTFFIKSDVHELTEQGSELEAHIYKYSNYLRDFSLLNEHEPVNVKIWDDIMIWAAVLGLTDEVYKQFQHLYPAYADESVYSSVVITSAISLSRSMNEAQSYSSSAGGGGSSSIGGGGGSFGGGTGGGTR